MAQTQLLLPRIRARVSKLTRVTLVERRAKSSARGTKSRNLPKGAATLSPFVSPTSEMVQFVTRATNANLLILLQFLSGILSISRIGRTESNLMTTSAGILSWPRTWIDYLVQVQILTLHIFIFIRNLLLPLHPKICHQ